MTPSAASASPRSRWHRHVLLQMARTPTASRISLRSRWRRCWNWKKLWSSRSSFLLWRFASLNKEENSSSPQSDERSGSSAFTSSTGKPSKNASEPSSQPNIHSHSHISADALRRLHIYFFSSDLFQSASSVMAVLAETREAALSASGPLDCRASEGACLPAILLLSAGHVHCNAGNRLYCLSSTWCAWGCQSTVDVVATARTNMVLHGVVGFSLWLSS